MNLDNKFRRKAFVVISQTTRLLKLEDINVNRLAPELFFLILARSVNKM